MSSRHAIPWSRHGCLSALIIVGSITSGAAAFMFGIVGRVPMEQGLAWLAASMIATMTCLSWARRPLLLEVRDDGTVHGAGVPMKVGEGSLFIQREEQRYKGNTTTVYSLRYTVNDTLLLSSTIDPLPLRNAGEALARVAKIPVHWGDRARDGLASESEGALPPPRNSNGGWASAPTPPSTAFVDVTERGDAVVIRAKPRWFLPVAGLGLTALSFAAFASNQWTGQAQNTLMMFSAFFALLSARALPSIIVETELVADENGLSFTRKLMGVTVQHVALAKSDVETVAIERGDLLIAGRDAAHARFTVGVTQGAADWVRGVLFRAGAFVDPALEGQLDERLTLNATRSKRAIGTSAFVSDVVNASDVASPSAVIAPVSQDLPKPLDDPNARTCPRCVARTLGASGGVLDDARCTHCRGRFLSPAGAERLLEGELGISKEILRGILQSFAGKRLTCPGCSSMTSPARLRGVACDLCTGCGGLWLDDGELRAITQGRHQG